MRTIYFLSEYNWECGELISEGPKNFKIRTFTTPVMRELIRSVPKEKCAFPGEMLCVVWEMWKGRNGRGGYRVEKQMYAADQSVAEKVGRQRGTGRVTEIAYGIKQ